MAKKHLVIQSKLSTENKAMLLIGCIAQELKTETERSLAQAGLTPPQVSILHALDWGPQAGMTVGELTAAMFEENPNVSRTLNRLVELGHITKIRGNDDQRVVRITITNQGRSAHHAGDKTAEGIGLKLKEADLNKLYEILKKIESPQDQNMPR